MVLIYEDDVVEAHYKDNITKLEWEEIEQIVFKMYLC